MVGLNDSSRLDPLSASLDSNAQFSPTLKVCAESPNGLGENYYLGRNPHEMGADRVGSGCSFSLRRSQRDGRRFEASLVLAFVRR